MVKSEKFQQLPPPWDRIFSLGTRLFVWGLLISILFLLRPFFLLIFLTFVFAYILEHGVEGLSHRFASRVWRVVVVFTIFLGLLAGTLYFLAPHVKEQMTDFLRNQDRYYQQADNAIYRVADGIPPLRRMLIEGATHKKPGDGEREQPRDTVSGPDPGPDPDPGDIQRVPPASTEPPPTDENGAQAVGPTDPHPPLVGPFVEDLLAKGGGVNRLGRTVAGILGVGSSFLLAVLFSFLIVLDLPKLSRGVAGLADTKLDFIYEEVADNIYHFAQRLGRALEAQLFIAICNTILTAIGIYALGLPSIVFLSSIVFFCSFIPVAGVFISSAPICLLALQTGGDDGVQLMLLAIGMILLVHFVEAYFLNPKIYGHHLRMNAVLVLIVLTIAGKLFGVWGLVLSLPVVNYFFSMAIRRSPDEAADEPVSRPIAVAEPPRKTAP